MNSEIEAKIFLSCILTKATEGYEGEQLKNIKKVASFFTKLCKYGCSAETILYFLKSDPSVIKTVTSNPFAFIVTFYEMGCPLTAMMMAIEEFSKEYDI